MWSVSVSMVVLQGLEVVQLPVRLHDLVDLLPHLVPELAVCHPGSAGDHLCPVSQPSPQPSS